MVMLLLLVSSSRTLAPLLAGTYRQSAGCCRTRSRMLFKPTNVSHAFPSGLLLLWLCLDGSGRSFLAAPSFRLQFSLVDARLAFLFFLLHPAFVTAIHRFGRLQQNVGVVRVGVVRAGVVVRVGGKEFIAGRFPVGWVGKGQAVVVPLAFPTTTSTTMGRLKGRPGLAELVGLLPTTRRR